jgi:acetylornithine deacetylase/succinyl-diaminopimelate desuccinylase-like protein
MASIDRVLNFADERLPQSMDRLFELLRFPSVGTDPQHHGDCLMAAKWLESELRAMGFAANLRQTTGHPLVHGEYRPKQQSAATPHVVFYGHYDVQPADPLELWHSAPFKPEIRASKPGRKSIYARGSSDDKGQVMTFLEACRAILKVHGTLPFRLTVLIEGDEESDNSHLDRFLKANRQAFRSDVAFICDTELWSDVTPGINIMLRGCICEEVTIRGPRVDLHSGDYGGAALNPIRALTRILADMHDAKGRVTIPGFYDGVKPPPAAVRKAWAKLNFPMKQFLSDVGLAIPAGESAFSGLEQMWARPTAEFNGIHGGYRGVGIRTVIPAEATAKLSFRLVGGQNPRKIRKALREFINARLPRDCRATITTQAGDSSGITVSSTSRWVGAAQKSLAGEWGRAPVLMGNGASIPVVESFKKHLGIDSLMVGFARGDDGQHSPNEKYDVDCFHKGIRSWARIISEFA